MIFEQNAVNELSEEEIQRLINIPEGYSGEEENPGKLISIILHISVYLFPVLFLSTLYLSITRMNSLNLLWTMLLAVPFSWLAGDFITGIVHWLCDTYGTVNTPVFGQTLIKNFRSHHKYPKDICVSPFVFTVGYVALASAFTLPIGIYFMIKYPLSASASIISFTYALITLLTVLTNQFHKWAHLESEKVPQFIKLLQKYNIVLNPQHHKVHHSNKYDSNYCITHGLNNPFLEKIKFFRTTESLLAKLGFNASS